MAEKKLEGAGLRGQVAGHTALSTVGKAGKGLTYRGYAIEELSEKATFEEVAFMLLYGNLPNQLEYDNYSTKLKSYRSIPSDLKQVLEKIPKTTHPMDVLRTGCSMLGNLEPEGDFSNQNETSDRILAALPSIITYWYRFSHDGVRVETGTDHKTIGGQFLSLLTGKEPSEEHARALDISLILYAEHGFNASTFTARICASTLSDMHSCVAGAIGTLRGPLHGGANEEAMDMIEKFSSREEANKQVKEMLANKDTIMGFGHAVYTNEDPRNKITKALSKKLGESSGNSLLYEVSEEVEKVMDEEKGLFANVDFYMASAYHYLGIPTPIFTPLFVIGRTSGWASNVMEQRADNRIIRPSEEYTGPDKSDWVDMSNR
ncbi:MAG: 2-methylcitrate synthase [Gammaproteobacteria bacterium]|nr:2-methylcitrate synthase [Gammaproteobacteria bacterium]|tara:strand:+ start:2195 stop:3319 length:1125 start_codon:yes stop_codon:yes gene_type:complete